MLGWVFQQLLSDLAVIIPVAMLFTYGLIKIVEVLDIRPILEWLASED